MNKVFPKKMMCSNHGIRAVVGWQYVPATMRTPDDEAPIIRSMGFVASSLDCGHRRYHGVFHAYIDSKLRMVGVGFNEKDEVIRKWEDPDGFKCVLCGQHITDGRPCGCGAR